MGQEEEFRGKSPDFSGGKEAVDPFVRVVQLSVAVDAVVVSRTGSFSRMHR